MITITADDMINRFGEIELARLTDHEKRQEINHGVLLQAMKDASETAESYLHGAQVAIKATPACLILRVCDIARFYLYENGATEIVKQRYEEAIKWLEKVMKNPSMLGVGVAISGSLNGSGNASSSIIAVRPVDVPKWGDFE